MNIEKKKVGRKPKEDPIKYKLLAINEEVYNMFNELKDNESFKSASQLLKELISFYKTHTVSTDDLAKLFKEFLNENDIKNDFEIKSKINKKRKIRDVVEKIEEEDQY